jgi:hypothetical protein
VQLVYCLLVGMRPHLASQSEVDNHMVVFVVDRPHHLGKHLLDSHLLVDLLHVMLCYTTPNAKVAFDNKRRASTCCEHNHLLSLRALERCLGAEIETTVYTIPSYIMSIRNNEGTNE